MKNKRTVTIHQPEHFPYMGFFQKMSKSDLFVVLDNVKYRKNYFQNRNRLRTLAGKDEWFTVAVEKKATSKRIKDVTVSADTLWRKKIIKKIKQNLSFDASEFYCGSSLMDINMRGIKWAKEELGIKTEIVFASELGVDGEKSELLANICKVTDADTYLSGPSGKNYLDMKYFQGIQVDFFTPKVDNNYSCLYNILKKLDTNL